MNAQAQNSPAKQAFFEAIGAFVADLAERVCTPDGQWAVKGFIDTHRNVYSISSDTKITSKILEIHIFPMLLEFAADHGFDLVLAEHQNHYPDMSFVSRDDPTSNSLSISKRLIAGRISRSCVTASRWDHMASIFAIVPQPKTSGFRMPNMTATSVLASFMTERTLRRLTRPRWSRLTKFRNSLR